MEPLATRCDALRCAHLLYSRTHWWWLRAPAALPPPAWPWDGPSHGAGRREVPDMHAVCTVHGQPMAPVVELMRHDATFRDRARCLLLAHARLRRKSPGAGLGSLPTQLAQFVVALAAHAEATECVGGFQRGFVAAPAPAVPRVRLCARPAQFPPLGADWAPLLQAVSAAAEEAAALEFAATMMDIDEPCRCLRLLRRGAAAVHDSVRAAMFTLRSAPPARGAAQGSDDDPVHLLAEHEDFDGLDDDDASLVDADEGEEELEPAMLRLVLEDSGDERSDAGDWHAIHGAPAPWDD